MSIITDGLLIATCLTAALYCVVLSRRLARFSDTESGIGKQIAQLNSILDETRSSTKETQSGAKAVSERLARDLASAKKVTQDLAAMIERAEATLDRDFELRAKSPQPEVTEATVHAPKPQAVLPEASPPPAAPKTEDATAPIDEQPHDDIAERDFDLADARGEPQLGFLPNVTDTSSVSDLSLEDSSEPDAPKDEADEQAFEVPPGDTENLLKAERMAL